MACRRLDLEHSAGYSTLPNDCLERSDSQFRMIGNWHCDGAEFRSPLHDDVATTLTDDVKPVLFKDAASVSSRKDTKLTRELLRNL